MQMTPLLAAKTDFTIGQSTLSPGAVMKAAKASGLTEVIIADTMMVSAAIPATEEADGVRPIIGATLTVVEDLEAKGRKVKNPFFMPRMFAKNDEGMKTIFKMLTRANQEDHFYFKPRLSLDDLVEFAADENVIITTGDFWGLFAHEAWREKLVKIMDAVSRDRLFVELSPIPTPLFCRVNSHAIEAVNEFDLTPLVTHPLLHDGNKEAFVTNLGMANRSDYNREFSIWRPHYNEFTPRTMQQMVSLVGATKDAISARYPSQKQGDVWKRGLIDGRRLFTDAAQYKWTPQPVSLPSLSADPDGAVKTLAKAGLAKRVKTDVFGYKPPHSLVVSEYIPRLKYELDILASMGFSDYFLVVADLVNWAKSQNILVGPGRGSVGGSLVAYCMGITDVDPIRFGLLFERFINPSRKDLPDADLDFMSERRHEVIRYLENEYGESRVSGITNYNTLKSASAMREVARVHGMNPDRINVSKLIPSIHGSPVDLETARASVPEIELFSTNNPAIWRDAVALQDRMKSFGRHAAGIIVAGEDIVNRAVIERRNNERSVNWDMSVVEKMGLIKLDILGLKTLDILGKTLSFIKERHGVDVEISNVPLDDVKTLEAFSKGQTVGIFQFEGGAARRILKDMSRARLVTFEDIVAANALNRPGPIEAGLVDQYVNRRNGLEEVDYPHPATEAALEPTFGVLVYQEQIMRISVDLCGFSLAEADTLRSVVGKKKKDAMAAMRDKFVQGAMAGFVKITLDDGTTKTVHKKAKFRRSNSGELVTVQEAVDNDYDIEVNQT